MSTIAAISTPLAPAGLGVLRLSGDGALSIAAKVVDLCMGKITARSEIGRGSVFVVEIPLGIS